MAESTATEAWKVAQLLELLEPDSSRKLVSALERLSTSGQKLAFRIDAQVCAVSKHTEEITYQPLNEPSIQLGYLNTNEIESNVTSSTLFSDTEVGHVAGNQKRLSLPNLDQHSKKRRKAVGGLRLGKVCPDGLSTGLQSPDETDEGSSCPSPMNSDGALLSTRKLQATLKSFPQRKKKAVEGHKAEPLSMERFITGIWKQIYGNVELIPIEGDIAVLPRSQESVMDYTTFQAINKLCSQATVIGRSSRALEVLVQAHWVDCFDERVRILKIEAPQMSSTEAKISALREASSVLQWSNKELQNRLRIWRGYQELRDASGWVTIIFAGSGLYRYCKYRTQSLTSTLVASLRKLRHSFEVAADTLHPRWRELLKAIDVFEDRKWTGHPHDWVVCDGSLPLSLEETYLQQDPTFTFEHISTSRIDSHTWGLEDPRAVSDATVDNHFCGICGMVQSDNTIRNGCQCYPELYGAGPSRCAVQVFRTPSGKNNGLVARSPFERGVAIGEFVGLITKDISGLDVMQGGHGIKQYQIYQGRIDNIDRNTVTPIPVKVILMATPL